MSDLSQPAVYGLLQKRLGSADPTNNPRGTVIDIATTQRVHQKYKRPASAPPRALPPGVEMRHRAWAPPPGGRKTLQEHLNIWGPCFGAQNTSWQRRYTSEMRRQFQGRQLPVVKEPEFREKKPKKKKRPQTAAPKLRPFKF